MSKYDTLEALLSHRSHEVWRASFADVEAVLGEKLPDSAYKYRAWWANEATRHTQANAWMKAGWHTEHVDLTHATVTFRKGRPHTIHLPLIDGQIADGG